MLDDNLSCQGHTQALLMRVTVTGGVVVMATGELSNVWEKRLRSVLGLLKDKLFITLTNLQ